MLGDLLPPKLPNKYRWEPIKLAMVIPAALVAFKILSTSSIAPTSERNAKPTIDALHRDIALANQYRLELIKLVMTLSAGILAFTVSFRPSLTSVSLPWLMWIGWISLAMSMVGGMVHMHGWDRFYLSYRDYDWRGEKVAGKVHRTHINFWRNTGQFFQFACFALGVLAIGLFAAINITNVVIKQ